MFFHRFLIFTRLSIKFPIAAGPLGSPKAVVQLTVASMAIAYPAEADRWVGWVVSDSWGVQEKYGLVVWVWIHAVP